MIQPFFRYKRRRFSLAVIAHAVWLYFQFLLSLRLVEEMLLDRAIVVSYEKIRRWVKKFGPDYARHRISEGYGSFRRPPAIGSSKGS